MTERAGSLLRKRLLVLAALPVLALQEPPPSPRRNEIFLARLVPSGTHPVRAGLESAAAIATMDVRDSGISDVRLLVEGFAYLGLPRISYDGRLALVEGRRSPGDPLAVWEFSLSGASLRQLTKGSDSWDPAFLPEGRIVYSRSTSRLGNEEGASLFTSRPDGSDQKQITFGQGRDSASTVLPDGRILFLRRQSNDDGGSLYTVNPDGSGIQLFAKPAEASFITAGPWMVEDRILFAERPPASAGLRLVSLAISQPLGDRLLIGEAGALGLDAAVEFDSVTSIPGRGIVLFACDAVRGWSLRADSQAVQEFAEAVQTARVPASDDLRMSVSGLVHAQPPELPLRITSVVDGNKATGTIFCLDVYASPLSGVGDAPRGSIRNLMIRDADGGRLGEAPIEEDGSFFVEVPSDRPLVLELLDSHGVVAQRGGPFWVRPNENRGCIGCHEDPELSPENRVVSAIRRGPSQLLHGAGVSDTESGSRPDKER